MSRFLLAASVLVATACTPARPAPTVAPTGGFAIQGVTVVDVERGVLRPGQTVVVQGNRIVSAGASATTAVPAGALRVDGTGRYLMPGLWDMHTHLNGSLSDSTYLLPAYIANGVTGVRDLWSDPPGVFDDPGRGISLLQAMQRMRGHVRGGRLAGPRMLLSTAPIDGPFGPDGGTHVIRSATEARQVVARGASDGVDIVGIYRWVDPAYYRAAAEAAREIGMPLAGGIPIAATFAEAAAAGHRMRDGVLEWELACSTIGDSVRAVLREAAQRDVSAMPADSARSMYRTFMAARPRLRETFDTARCMNAARSVARDGIWQMPRLVYGKPVASGGAHAAAAAPYLPRNERAAWSARVAPITRDSTGRIGAQAAHERRIFRILHDAGIPFVVGTESYFGSPSAWGFSVHDELVELVAIGLSPAEALRAATLEPARAMGVADSLGTIAPGKLADLVLLDADPLADIRNTTRIQGVIANGVLHDRVALDSLLARVRTAADASGQNAVPPAGSLVSADTDTATVRVAAQAVVNAFAGEVARARGGPLGEPPVVHVRNTPQLIFFNPSANEIVVPWWEAQHSGMRGVFRTFAGGDDAGAEHLFRAFLNRFLVAHEAAHWFQGRAGRRAPTLYENENIANRMAVAFWRTQPGGEAFLAELERLATAAAANLQDPTPAGEDPVDYFGANYRTLGAEPLKYGYYQFRFMRDALRDRGQLDFEKMVADQ